MEKEELKQIRGELGLSQSSFGAWLGKEFGVWAERTGQAIWLWESGKIPVPGWVDYMFSKRRKRLNDTVTLQGKDDHGEKRKGDSN
jgi:hypothetical protein